MWPELLLALSFLGFAACNITITDNNYQSRQHRLLSFNTDDEGDVSVELAFNVPFLKIPVKRSLDSVKGFAMANVNVGAIALSASLILGAMGALPVISWLFTKKTHYPHRSSDETELVYSQILKLLEDYLMQKNLEPLACFQKLLCWSVKSSSRRVKYGKGDSTDKIIDGLAGSELLKYVVDGTMMKEAIDNGIQGSNCVEEYQSCKISQSDLEMFTGLLLKG